METGNKTTPISSLFKKEFHLTPDNEAELQTSGIRSFVDFGRNQIQILKVSTELKAVEMVSFQFPNCINDERWIELLSGFLNTEEYVTFIRGTQIVYSVSDFKVVLVPDSIYKEDKKDDLFYFARNSPNNLIIQKQVLSRLNAIGLSSFPTELEGKLNLKATNSYLVWLNSLIVSGKYTTAHLVFRNNTFTLVILKHGDLIFSNCFNISKPEDVLYFLMATLESLNVLHTEVSVVLNGETEKNDEVHVLINRYISQVVFAKPPSTLKFAYSFKDISAHRFPFILQMACA